MKLFCVVVLILLTLGCGGYGSGPSAPGATPSIMQLSPNAATAGGAGFVLTINGSNFGTGATVYWNNVAHGSSYVTGNQITANISAADIANPGDIQVYVRNDGNNSNTLTFKVN